MFRTLTVPTTTHGRVIVRRAASGGASAGHVVGFHGYGQSAETMLADLERVPGIDAWHVVSVQGLHRFYTRDNQTVIASWMTRQDRDEAIADNVAYVNAAVAAALADAASSPHATSPARIVFAGFSQGVAMAYRAAVLGRHPAAGILALGGDVPPDLSLEGAPAVLIGAGDRDTWYTADKVAADAARLDAAGVSHQIVPFAGGHLWTDDFRRAAGAWLQTIIRG